MQDFHTVIYGKDLKSYLSSQKDPLAEKIDPEGVNVVIMSLLHNDVDIRAVMYLKLLGMNEPQEANIDFPINTYNAIQQTVTSDGNTVH